tara:strand:- start:26976 stop:28868 length:1893 start_codon:yes stop_codon:yes gene_type:complete
MADDYNSNDGNNPRNKQSGLFKSLTRLFSGPIVDYDRPAVIRTNRRDVKKYTFTTGTGREFKKKEYYNPFGSLSNKVLTARNKQIRYTDFDQMEYMPEIASTLDIYADEITTSTVFNPIVAVDCSNREIKDILTTLMYTVLNIESNLFGWARSMCKYGDYYLYMDIDDKLGITNVIPLPVREIERIEGTDKTNPNYIQYFWQGAEGNKGVTFENWQVCHFRVLGNDKYVPNGTSVLEPSRRIWRQLTLLEDAMMAYRIVRSPERRVFYIDVGNISPEDVEQYIEQVKTQMKRNQIVDEDNGRVDLRYNAMSVDEDYYIPIRGAASNTRIETLAGGQFTGDIDDVNYLRDKLFSALKVPKAYLAQTDAIEDKTTLSQKDIRFARTIQRLQRVVVAELEKMCIVHLYTLGFRDSDLTSFNLTLNNPSKIAELQELEHLRTKFDIAGAATDGYFSKRWVYKNIFKLDNEEVERIQIEMYGDAKFGSAIEEAGTIPDTDGGAGGDDDFGDMLGGDDLATEELPEEEPGALLAEPEPGQRDDGKPRGRQKRGARLRSDLAKAGGESAKPGNRNKRRLFNGGDSISKQLVRPMDSLGNGIVRTRESVDKEEEILFNNQFEIGKLIEQLESKDEGQA